MTNVLFVIPFRSARCKTAPEKPTASPLRSGSHHAFPLSPSALPQFTISTPQQRTKWRVNQTLGIRTQSGDKLVVTSEEGDEEGEEEEGNGDGHENQRELDQDEENLVQNESATIPNTKSEETRNEEIQVKRSKKVDDVGCDDDDDDNNNDDDDNDDDDDDDGRTKDRIALSFEDIKGLRVSLNLELGMRQVYESIVEDAIEEQIQEDVTGERGGQN